jgi:hypothetical protein
VSAYERLERTLRTIEARTGAWAASALMGLLGLGLAALCVRLGTEPASLGRFYAALSQDPLAFDADNPVGFRILTPLLSWCLGLRGDAIQITNLGLAAVVLAWIHATTRRLADSRADAAIAVGVFALSLVTLSTVHAPSYCDPATYLAVLGMLAARKQPAIYYAVFFVGLLNRESLMFLVPWLAFERWRMAPSAGSGGLEPLMGFGVGLGALLLFRAWVGSRVEVAFSLDYYLTPLWADPLHYFRMTWGTQLVGWFSVFGVLWAIPFAAVLAKWRRGDRAGLASMALVLVCAGSQLFFAYDTSRLLTLGFPVMWLALEELSRQPAFGFRRWVPWLLVVQFLLPQLRSARGRVWMMDAPWRDWLVSLF